MFGSQHIQLLGPFKTIEVNSGCVTCSLLWPFRGTRLKKELCAGKMAHMAS